MFIFRRSLTYLINKWMATMDSCNDGCLLLIHVLTVYCKLLSFMVVELNYNIFENIHNYIATTYVYLYFTQEI